MNSNLKMITEASNNHSELFTVSHVDSSLVEPASNGASNEDIEAPKDFIEACCGEIETNDIFQNHKRKLNSDISISGNGRKRIKNYDEDLIASSDDKGRGKRIRKPTKKSKYLDDYIDEEEEKKIEEADLHNKLALHDKSDWKYTRDSGDKAYRPTYRHPRVINNKQCNAIDSNNSNSNGSPHTKQNNVNNGDLNNKSICNNDKEDNLFENIKADLKSIDSTSSEIVKITTLIPTFNGGARVPSSHSDSAEDISSEQFFVKHIYHQNEVPDNSFVNAKMSNSVAEEINENDDIEGLTIIDISASDDEMCNMNVNGGENQQENDKTLKKNSMKDNLEICKLNDGNKSNNEPPENDNDGKLGDISINTMTATEENSRGDLDDSSLSDFDAGSKYPPPQPSQICFPKSSTQSPAETKGNTSELTTTNGSLSHQLINGEKEQEESSDKHDNDPLMLQKSKIVSNEFNSSSKQLSRSKKPTKNQQSKYSRRNTSRDRKDRRRTNKFDDIYDEEDEINSRIVSRYVSKSSQRNGHLRSSLCKTDRRKLADNNSHPSHIGPYIHCNSLKNLPAVCKIMNVKDSSDPSEISHGNAKYSMLSSESSSIKAASQMIANVPWKCVFCSRGNCHTTLGELYGPYIPQQTNILLSPNIDLVNQNSPPKLTAETNISNKPNTLSGSKKLSQKSIEKTSSKSNVLPNGLPAEIWVHGDCAIWAGGVCVAGGRVKGLEEAALVALNSICCLCSQKGATVGCLVKGCNHKYHFICAKGAGCAFQEENFSLLCPKHKTKTPRTYKPASADHIIQTITLN